MCSYLSELTLSFSVSGRALPRTGRDGAPLAAPRSTSSLARIRSEVLSDSEPDFRAASAVVIVLPVTTAGTARGRDIPIEKQFVPTAWRDGRRHGQTDVVFASRPATAGRLAFISAAGLTARGCERSGALKATGISSSPFVRDSRVCVA